jgi:hypothetical protein
MVNERFRIRKFKAVCIKKIKALKWLNVLHVYEITYNYTDGYYRLSDHKSSFNQMMMPSFFHEHFKILETE